MDEIQNKESAEYPVEKTLNSSKEKTIVPFLDSELGSEVTFGNFEQDGNADNGAEPLEWIVLDRKGESALLLSKYILDFLPFQSSGKNSNNKWSDSEIRAWLNRSFYEIAFSEKEKAFVETRERWNYENTDYQTSMDKLVSDSVFLLSFQQLTQTDTESSAGYVYHKPYFWTRASLLALPTESAGRKLLQDNKDYERTTAAWWSCSTGKSEEKACYVDAAGNVVTAGIEKSSTKVGVRPAVWINLKDIDRLYK